MCGNFNETAHRRFCRLVQIYVGFFRGEPMFKKALFKFILFSSDDKIIDNPRNVTS